MQRAAKLLFLLHAVATAAAGVVPILWPAAIPATVGVVVPANAAPVAYLLGACELGVAALSFGARTRTDRPAIRVVCSSCVAMHVATISVQLYAYARGDVSAGILANVALRVVVAAAFAWLGRG